MSRVESIQSNSKTKKEMTKTIDEINRHYSTYCHDLGFDPNNRKRILPTKEERARGQKYFVNRTETLRKEVKTYIALGYSEEEALERILPKAYGLVRAASAFIWNKPHYEVQLQGGILLHQGYASEMATGEGKTLTATLPAYLNALLQKGAHVITPNGYLAKRDCEEMSELYTLLGLSCGLVEERTSLSEDAIVEKTIGILGPELKEYTQNAKSKEEKQTLINNFINDRKNRTKVKTARKKAIEALRMEETLKRRAAYNADITYGSSSSFAFDYLRDDIELDKNKLVQRQGRPNFAVIDEVDAVLFDDATTPFTLSGEQTDEERAITTEERELRMRKINRANLAIAKINSESKKLYERYGSGQALVSYIRNNDDKYEAVVRNETDDAHYQDMTRAIIINSNTKDYTITTLGEIMLFQYYCDKDVNNILKEHLNKVISLKFEDGPMYREGYDYIINEYGRIEMEPRAFAHLVMSGAVKELTQRFEMFGQNELINYRSEIDNAIRAWYVLEKDVDYKLSAPNNPKAKDEQVVSLVMNGRTAEGRVYSNGLQQAIEAKIRYTTGTQIRETEIKNTLASIPTASFFARYAKFGGMTGTSARSAFRNLYGLETKSVDRQRPKMVIDHGERMYASTDEKNEAIFQEVLKSYKKGQPVLLSTTSIGESIALYEFLNKRFKEHGYVVNIPVLNANVNLEQEAAIVSKAGLPKAITIATEMAGRGTDIKLGGEIPEVSELIPIIAEEKANEIVSNLSKKQLLTNNQKETIKDRLLKQLLADRDRLEPFAIARQKIMDNERYNKKLQVEQAGGLKVIGSGHFTYSRVDDQVKGRCGRQGDPGEVIFFNDQQDLLRVGVPKEVVERLQLQAEKAPIIEDPTTNRCPISDVVYDAQMKTESITETIIKLNQEVESEVSKYRRGFRSQRERLKQSGDYIDTMVYLIEETTKSVILGSSKENTPHLTDKTRLSNANLDYEELSLLSAEFLGVTINSQDIKHFKTLGELRTYITNQSVSSFEEKVKTEGKEKVNEECKEVIDKMFGRVWSDFEDFVDTIKYQDRLNKMSQFQGGMEIAPQIARAYQHAAETERGLAVRSVINPNYKATLEREESIEIIPMRMTPHGFEKVPRDFDQQQQAYIEEFVEENQQGMNASISNLQPHSRIFTLVNHVKLNKDASQVGKYSQTTNADEMEVVDFGEGKKGKR